MIPFHTLPNWQKNRENDELMNLIFDLTVILITFSRLSSVTFDYMPFRIARTTSSMIFVPIFLFIVAHAKGLYASYLKLHDLIDSRIMNPKTWCGIRKSPWVHAFQNYFSSMFCICWFVAFSDVNRVETMCTICVCLFPILNLQHTIRNLLFNILRESLQLYKTGSYWKWHSYL